MKNTLTLILAFLLLSPFAARAQECMGLTMKEGSGFEMLSLNGRGKEDGRIVYKITKVSKEGSETVIDMDMEYFDKKDNSQMKNTFKMRCDGNEMRLDASAMMPQGQSEQMASMDMKFTSKDMIYPGNLSVGQKLPDASMHGEGGMAGITMTFDTDIINRKVESKENITVPAGTFEAFKITYDMDINIKSVMKMNQEMSTISYRSPKVLWDIKTETYRKGKLMGSTVLSKIL